MPRKRRFPHSKVDVRVVDARELRREQRKKVRQLGQIPDLQVIIEQRTWHIGTIQHRIKRNSSPICSIALTNRAFRHFTFLQHLRSLLTKFSHRQRFLLDIVLLIHSARALQNLLDGNRDRQRVHIVIRGRFPSLPLLRRNHLHQSILAIVRPCALHELFKIQKLFHGRPQNGRLIATARGIHSNTRRKRFHRLHMHRASRRRIPRHSIYNTR